MKISCDIIRDILPLYAEDMVSKATRKMVEGHLCECESCTRELDPLRKESALPVKMKMDSLNRVKKMLFSRQILTVCTVLLTVASIVFGIAGFMFTPVLLTAEEAIEGVELREDGGLAIDYAPIITGLGSGPYGDNQGVLAHTVRYDSLISHFVRSEEDMIQWYKEIYEEHGLEMPSDQELSDRYNCIYVHYGTWHTNDGTYMPYDPETCVEGEGRVIDPQGEINFWYVNINDGTAGTLIWDGGKPYPDANEKLISYCTDVLLWLTVAAVGLTALFGAVYYLNRERSFGRGFLNCAVLSGSYALSSLVITGGRFASETHEISNKLIWIGGLTLLIFATVNCCRKLRNINKVM